MPTVFNDLGNPATDPCGFTVGGLCGTGDYGSWFRLAQVLDGQLAVFEVGSKDDPALLARRVAGTLLRGEFRIFPPASSIAVAFFPSDRTRALAAWCQRAADFLTIEPGQAPALPPSIFEPPKPAAPAPGFFSGVGTGTVLALVAAGGGLYYARRRGWI